MKFVIKQFQFFKHLSYFALVISVVYKCKLVSVCVVLIICFALCLLILSQPSASHGIVRVNISCKT